VTKNQIFNSDSGLHFVVQVDTSLSEKQLVERAKENSIYLYGLHEFHYGNYPKNLPMIVFGYSSIRLEMIKPAVEALKQAWNRTIPPSS
jgi:GntR family transcriptional regulator/MocR family aminotransferase